MDWLSTTLSTVARNSTGSAQFTGSGGSGTKQHDSMDNQDNPCISDPNFPTKPGLSLKKKIESPKTVAANLDILRGKRDDDDDDKIKLINYFVWQHKIELGAQAWGCGIQRSFIGT